MNDMNLVGAAKKLDAFKFDCIIIGCFKTEIVCGATFVFKCIDGSRL